MSGGLSKLSHNSSMLSKSFLHTFATLGPYALLFRPKFVCRATGCEGTRLLHAKTGQHHCEKAKTRRITGKSPESRTDPGIEPNLKFSNPEIFNIVVKSSDRDPKPKSARKTPGNPPVEGWPREKPESGRKIAGKRGPTFPGTSYKFEAAILNGIHHKQSNQKIGVQLSLYLSNVKPIKSVRLS